MKKFILAAIAASVVVAPVAAEAAAPQHRQVVKTVKHQRGGTVVTKRVVKRNAVNARKWQRGQRFDTRQARNYRQIDYRQVRGGYAPPRGYRWVQSDNDAVLVSIASGLIGAVIGGALFN